MRRVAFVFLFCVALVVSRRPDVLFHAQFWAEDGKIWYANAYNLGFLEPFTHPAAGYFVTLPRIVALAGLLVPMVWAPLFFNCIAIVFQVLPAQFLLSDRCDKWGSLRGRALLAFLYLALPNSHEMHANITNTQWCLALLALMILFARPGGTTLWSAFDLTVLTLCAFSGPFMILLAPIAAIHHASDLQSRWRLPLLVISGIGALTQGLAVAITGGEERVSHAVRGATPELLVQIVAKQVFLAVLLGRRTLAGLSFESGLALTVAILAVVAGVAIETYVLLKAPPVLKALVLFSLAILCVSLAFPMTKSPQWPALLASGGVRYWFFPMLTFVASAIWMLHARNPVFVRGAGAALVLVMMFGMIQDWGHPRPVDFRFPEYVDKFSKLPSGTRLFIPINPAGWTMELMKR